jgi:hypothetical protein
LNSGLSALRDGRFLIRADGLATLSCHHITSAEELKTILEALKTNTSIKQFTLEGRTLDQQTLDLLYQVKKDRPNLELNVSYVHIKMDLQTVHLKDTLSETENAEIKAIPEAKSDQNLLVNDIESNSEITHELSTSSYASITNSLALAPVASPEIKLVPEESLTKCSPENTLDEESFKQNESYSEIVKSESFVKEEFEVKEVGGPGGPNSPEKIINEPSDSNVGQSTDESIDSSDNYRSPLRPSSCSIS